MGNAACRGAAVGARWGRARPQLLISAPECRPCGERGGGQGRPTGTEGGGMRAWGGAKADGVGVGAKTDRDGLRWASEWELDHDSVHWDLVPTPVPAAQESSGS